jgi:hypothetical protein
MADMDRVLQIEVLDHRRCVRRIVVHVMAAAHLSRATMSAPVVGDDAVAFAEEVKQLRVPIIRAQWPAVMKHEGLRISRAPILVEDLHSIRGSYGVHAFAPSNVHDELASSSMTSKVKI